jgi:hypothetical protein
MVICLIAVVGVFELLCLLGFIFFYPGIEGDGVGRSVPLSLATELVTYAVYAYSDVKSGIIFQLSYRYVSQLGALRLKNIFYAILILVKIPFNQFYPK